MIEKEWCKECKGLGHTPDCKCEGPVAFIVGCCKTCGGEGTITIKPKENPPDETRTSQISIH